MLRPAFRATRIAFGRHHGTFTFPDDGRPLVIAGANGSGKSTLVEAVVRTLFGYERRRSVEAAHMDARRPWAGGALTGEVTVALRGESVRIQRDFDTDRVRVDSPAEGLVHFEGDGNPGASNQEARHYRRILTDLFGIADFESYQRTLYIRQGGLPGTAVGDHLLRVAAGGHARVDGARRDIAEAHRAVTRRPIHSAARAAINARELEKVEDEIAAVRARLEAARQAGERRGPITLERDRAADRLSALDEEIRLLEDARSALSRAGAREVEARQLREWSRKLDRAADRLRRAADENRAAEAGLSDVLREGRYPDDFPERLAGVELRWRDLDALATAPARWPGVAGLTGLAAAVALWLAGMPLLASAPAILGGLGLVAWLALRIDARRRRRNARAEIDAMLSSVPDANTLSPRSRGRHLARFRAQRTAEARREEARAELATMIRSTRDLLNDAGRAGLGVAVPPPDEREGEGGMVRRGSRVAALLERLAGTAEQARERLAHTRVDLDRVGNVSLQLPDGVPPTETDVAAGLADRRAERTRLQRDLQELGQELLERGTPSESDAALEARLADLLPRRDALDRKARVLEAAHALVTDAYDAFRARDQERLLDHVSTHARSLSGGGAGPMVVRGPLEDATVHMEGRVLPLGSPPLSFGELHALLLAVRLGAADFLAGVGVLPPLIVDEPFAHLDRDRAAAVWDILKAVAAERQVIVTTQDDFLLDALGIEADIRLSRG